MYVYKYIYIYIYIYFFFVYGIICSIGVYNKYYHVVNSNSYGITTAEWREAFLKPSGCRSRAQSVVKDSYIYIYTYVYIYIHKTSYPPPISHSH